MRAYVLMSANSRRAIPGLPVESLGASKVPHVNRVREGVRERYQLAWQRTDIDFVVFLFDHYRTHRNDEFEVDMNDGKGFQAYEYAGPPQLSATRFGSGTYSVEIKKAEVS